MVGKTSPARSFACVPKRMLTRINRLIWFLFALSSIVLANNSIPTVSFDWEDIRHAFPVPFETVPSGNLPRILILDLDNTLVYSEKKEDDEMVVHFRPHLDEFMHWLSKHFVIVIYSAGIKEYVNGILDDFIKKNYSSIVGVLSRKDCLKKGKSIFKDVGKFSNYLDNLYIVDDRKDVYIFPEEYQVLDKFIKVNPWTGDLKDSELLNVKHMLETLIISTGLESVLDESEQK